MLSIRAADTTDTTYDIFPSPHHCTIKLQESSDGKKIITILASYRPCLFFKNKKFDQLSSITKFFFSEKDGTTYFVGFKARDHFILVQTDTFTIDRSCNTLFKIIPEKSFYQVDSCDKFISNFLDVAKNVLKEYQDRVKTQPRSLQFGPEIRIGTIAAPILSSEAKLFENFYAALDDSSMVSPSSIRLDVSSNSENTRAASTPTFISQQEEPMVVCTYPQGTTHESSAPAVSQQLELPPIAFLSELRLDIYLIASYLYVLTTGRIDGANLQDYFASEFQLPDSPDQETCNKILTALSKTASDDPSNDYKNIYDTCQQALSFYRLHGKEQFERISSAMESQNKVNLYSKLFEFIDNKHSLKNLEQLLAEKLIPLTSFQYKIISLEAGSKRAASSNLENEPPYKKSKTDSAVVVPSHAKDLVPPVPVGFFSRSSNFPPTPGMPQQITGDSFSTPDSAFVPGSSTSAAHPEVYAPTPGRELPYPQLSHSFSPEASSYTCTTPVFPFSGPATTPGVVYRTPSDGLGTPDSAYHSPG